jgi:hypothetical protein
MVWSASAGKLIHVADKQKFQSSSQRNAKSYRTQGEAGNFQCILPCPDIGVHVGCEAENNETNQHGRNESQNIRMSVEILWLAVPSSKADNRCYTRNAQQHDD